MPIRGYSGKCTTLKKVNTLELFQYRLLTKVQNRTAAEQHENQSAEKKQAHKDIEHAVSLSTGVFNFVHMILQNCCGAKNCGAKVEKPAAHSDRNRFFFTFSEQF